MIRDGHFLPEPPIKIGAGYDRAQRRDDFTPDELDIQSMLLGDRPRSRRRALNGYEVAGVVAAGIAAIHGLFWLVVR